jgi:parallel beta-helix repeat protein
VIGIILLFIGLGLSASTGLVSDKESNIVQRNGNILYVGGSGPGNYSKIQDAIDNASDGDTVFVYDDSSPYNENLIINKTLNLIGEDKETTEINGYDTLLDVVNIYNTSNVKVQGFTIKNSYNDWIGGIRVHYSDHCIISDNNIIDHSWAGIFIPKGCDNLTIISNTISKVQYGILFNYGGKNCLIKDNIVSGDGYNKSIVGMSIDGTNIHIAGNTITNNFMGLDLMDAKNFVMTHNDISKNIIGINIHDVFNSTINFNIITNNALGMLLIESTDNIIQNNNFIVNVIHNLYVIYEFKHRKYPRNNDWESNYYSRWIGFIPKPIIVAKVVWIPDPWPDPGLGYEILIPWRPIFESRPALKPNDIEV